MKYLFSFFLGLLFLSVNATQIENKLNEIYSYLDINNEKAFSEADSLLKIAVSDNNLYLQVKLNYVLGYLSKSSGEYGKSVLYYLEGIRIADKTDYSGIIEDKISIRKNLANIFRRFESNNLATTYNIEAISLCKESNNESKLTEVLLNQALVYQNNKEFDNAIALLNEILDISVAEQFNVEVLNQIGLAYLESGNNTAAYSHFNNIIDMDIPDIEIFQARSLHNLGEIAYKSGDKVEAINHLTKAIEIYNSLENTNYYSLFLSQRNAGRYLFETGAIVEAEEMLMSAIGIFKYAESDPSSFEVFKILSDLYFNTNRPAEGNHYSQLYFNKVQSFIETQKEIQKQDKEYNFELITKRYFDNVDKQERIASILFISKLSSGSLLALLLLVIVYYQMGKMRLRKSIENELRSLKVLD